MDKIKIGNKEVMPFTIPSGIITTSAKCLEKLAKEVEELGILTTKSIGVEARAGYREPVLHQYAPGSFVNAVGLTNPGCEKFLEELSEIDFPRNKFLLVSVFGKDANEFIKVVRTLEPYSDGFELNVSCPHAKGYGMQIGQDSEMTGGITKRVRETTRKPVLVKLPPLANIVESARAAVNAGADGLVLINTERAYSPILTNGNCGISGRAILPLGLRCVRDVRQAVGDKVFIIGMGGITFSRDVIDYKNAGANAFGIGSALAGMDDRDISDYFTDLRYDLSEGTNMAERRLKKVDMSYKKVRIEEIVNPDCDFRIVKTNEIIESKPGQFIFAWIPRIGEKPLSVMDDYPLTLGVLTRGYFTEKFNSLKQGDEFYIRGPYGQGVEDKVDGQRVSLIGGGCGIAGLYLLAKKFTRSEVRIFLGAKSKNYLSYLDEFKKFGEVFVSSEDGSLGKKGFVTDLFGRNEFYNTNLFFNCGPKAMVDAVLPFEIKVTSPEKIFSSLDYMTRCGVGICGSCADKKGRRACVEGPFINLP